MGFLSLDRRIDAEVLDARGGLAVMTGGTRLTGTLKEVPQLFVSGSQLAIALTVGGDRFEAVCRVLDEAVVVTPGSRMQLEVLRALPADVSGIEPFDLVPQPAETAAAAAAPPFITLEDQPSVEDDEPTGVVGTLKEMPVCEIVQALAQGAKDAVVEVKPKGRDGGTIGMERGKVVFAKTRTQVGEAAFTELFGATRGAFRIRYGRHTGEKNIARDTTFLLLEAARQQDESGRHARAVPPPLPPKIDSVALPPVLEPEDAGVTLIDATAPYRESGETPAGGVPLIVPAMMSQSGPFTRFFDEAGVVTPAPLPETQRFTSLALREIADADDDAVDTDRTRRERRLPTH